MRLLQEEKPQPILSPQQVPVKTFGAKKPLSKETEREKNLK